MVVTLRNERISQAWLVFPRLGKEKGKKILNKINSTKEKDKIEDVNGKHRPMAIKTN